MKNKIILILLFVSIIIFQSNTFVLAHGGGVSYEEQKNGYFIDIGYNEEFPVAHEPIRFDFVTYPEDKESIEGEVFTDVWVRISEDKKLYFSGGINKPKFGVTGFTYAFPQEGTYQILARFQNDGETVVETSFFIEVLPVIEDSGDYNLIFIVGGISFTLGTMIMFFLRRKKISEKIQEDI